MKFIYSYSVPTNANAKLNGRYILVRPEPPLHNMPIVTAKNIDKAIQIIGAEPYINTFNINANPLKTLTKRELVDRLIDRDLAEGFVAILESLPLAEKLRYDASPTISPEYPYIAENLAAICTALDITEEEFKDIFR